MKKQYPILLFLSAILLGSHLCFGQLDPKLAPIITQFGSKITSDINTDNVHGSISVAILKDKKIIWSGAFGYAGHEKDIPADTGTIYRVGSITKSFTSVLLMQLVEEGKIKLDDPVEKYLPEIKGLKGYTDAGAITFRQLASHTSGLKREPDLHNASVGPIMQWENKVLECIPNSSFNSKPGKEFLYSNIGVAILGLAIERIAGVPYLQLIQQRIFTPLHMNDTFFVLTNDKFPRLAEGIENSNGSPNTKIPARELLGRGYRVPNGGIFSTPNDLAKFVTAITEKPTIITEQSLQEMRTIPEGGHNYGLGLILTKNKQLTAYGHDGSVAGYTSAYAIDQESGYAVILMRNYNVGSTKLYLAVLDLLKELKQAGK